MEATFRSGTTVLGRYRVESVLGRDGMYRALRVSHAQLGELVLKMLLPEAAISLSVHARFVREAQGAALGCAASTWRGWSTWGSRRTACRTWSPRPCAAWISPRSSRAAVR